MFIKILKVVGATFLLLIIWYYIVQICSSFGENAKAVGGFLGFILVVYLWIKEYKNIFKTEKIIKK